MSIMHEVLLLGVLGCAYGGFALLALSQARHWRSVTSKPYPAPGGILLLRVGGYDFIGNSLVLALLRDGSSFGGLLWATSISLAALAVALTLAGMPARQH